MMNTSYLEGEWYISFPPVYRLLLVFIGVERLRFSRFNIGLYLFTIFLVTVRKGLFTNM